MYVLAGKASICQSQCAGYSYGLSVLSQVAGLPPVTKDWFEARKAQLSTAAAAPHTKIWYDPLTKKKFQTQQTYQVRCLADMHGFVAVCLGSRLNMSVSACTLKLAASSKRSPHHQVQPAT